MDDFGQCWQFWKWSDYEVFMKERIAPVAMVTVLLMLVIWPTSLVLLNIQQRRSLP